MLQLKPALYLSLTAVFAYLFSISSLIHLTPQLIALFGIILIVLFSKTKRLSIYLIALIINSIVFSTGGLNSPVFFLIYFLLFTIAFQNPPSTTLFCSLIIVLILSQSLNSTSSLLPLISLIFIAPLAWLVGQQYLSNAKLDEHLENEETSVFFWLTLNCKNALLKILDSVSILQSDPSLTHSQKEELNSIKKEAKELLSSSQNLTLYIDQETDND